MLAAQSSLDQLVQLTASQRQSVGDTDEHEAATVTKVLQRRMELMAAHQQHR